MDIKIEEKRLMSALPAKKRMTVEEYLAFERASEEKHQFIDGNVYLMVGASENHNLIVTNSVISLGMQLRERPCKLYANDMRVQIQQNYVYPDLIAVCGEAKFADDSFDTLLNPTLIIEVLSPSTEQYDRGKKFALYRSLDSLQEYLLIAQDRAHAERYIRQAAGWLLTETKELDPTLELLSIGCTLSLANAYAKVSFESGKA